MTSIKAIAFDLGGVIVTSFGEGMLSHASHVLGIERQELRHRMDEHEVDLVSGAVDHVTFWRRVSPEQTISLSDATLAKIWDEPYRAQSEVNHEMIELVRRLRERYIIGCISNTQEPHIAYNRSRGVLDEFPICILSSEVGLSKPHQDIFQLFLQRADCDARETIFIDDEEKHLRGAKVAGMRTILYRDVRQLEHDLRANGIVW